MAERTPEERARAAAERAARRAAREGRPAPPPEAFRWDSPPEPLSIPRGDGDAAAPGAEPAAPEPLSIHRGDSPAGASGAEPAPSEPHFAAADEAEAAPIEAQSTAETAPDWEPEPELVEVGAAR